ncbi:MAG: hypothetical protein ACR2HH_09090 [Chthoniobacterales bacterium]
MLLAPLSRIKAIDFTFMKIDMPFVLMIALLVQPPELAVQEAAAPGKVAIKRVAFTQSCFWTGEMKLGQTERGKSGFSQRNWRGEVVFKTPTWTSR